MRLTRIIILLFLFPLLISLSACGKSPEKARKELDRMNIAYNSNTFVEYAQKGDITIIDLFLIAGMDPNLENTDGITALYVTSEEGHTAIVKTLLSKGANVRTNKGRFGVTPLMGAARKGHLEIVRELIRKGADVNTTVFDLTALMIAASNGRTEIVKLLLDKGAYVNLRTKSLESNMTALSMAKQKGHMDIVKILEDAGAKEE
ncbi:MAG TPA: hypothetical protein DHU69_05105 [Deltaproteobacteria bacterium]|nr:hypothetical protein [Deltaproteobacteria bacterium]HCY19133.1 hypothetical protein [Deltaproteobacteria bacterium]